MEKDDIIAGIAYMGVSIMILLTGLSHFEKINDWIGFLGSLVSGIITLIVMYFTNKDGRKNVEATIKSNKDLHKQQEKATEENYTRQLMQLWRTQYSYLIDGYKVWQKDNSTPIVKYPSMELDKLLNILSHISSLNYQNAATIIGFNKNLDALNESKENYVRLLRSIHIDYNTSKELEEKVQILKSEYSDLLALTVNHGIEIETEIISKFDE